MLRLLGIAADAMARMLHEDAEQLRWRASDTSTTRTKKLVFDDMGGGHRRHNMQCRPTLAAATFEGCVAGYGHCCAGLVALKERRFLTPKLPDIDVFGGIVFALMGGSFQ
ncbi:hypothetical protein e1012e08.tmp0121 [Eimeria tenella]|uniref:Uncharacterized protein n=1 Tax=Eimeria tenella TaxID=5802 RepID=C8TDK7_EIMTE|nr:hypothetical protein e1012e08.tmp0121 [Eimeria tenella]